MSYDLDEPLRAFALRFADACRGIATRARETDEGAALAAQNWRDMADAGYLGLFHARRFGGSEADGRQLALAMEQLARACASTFWSATISTLLCGRMLADLCSPAHCDRWLRPIVMGEAIGCFAASEHGAGSDPGSYRTTLQRGPDGYRLYGEKSRISNAGVADVAIVLARLDEPTASKLCYVVVDLRSPGVHRSELPKLGLRGMSWGTLGFDGVAIAAADVIVDASVELTMRSVEWGQLLQVWCALGLAESTLEACREHAAGRHAFGRPIAHLPVVYERIAGLRAELDGARLLALEATIRKANDQPARELVMMAKIHATELAVRIADAAMRTLGGWGYAKQHVVERLLRDSYANVPAGLPTDRLRELLVCPLLGIDPWIYEPFDVEGIMA
jgi:alkylation response protein AidB-like acyl-CoA dehydrogenase